MSRKRAASPGAVAAGSPYTVEAGLDALRAGGNAVDAAVAASLVACVAEPLLTGLCGAGIGMVRAGGKVEAWDLFADVPGTVTREWTPPPMREVLVDFGPTSQVFHAGAPSFAVPGLAVGLCALHAAHGRLPLPRLARAAVAAGREGVDVSLAFERVAELLWPILQVSDDTARLFGPRGRPPARGDRFVNPDLSALIERFAAEGPETFRSGAVARGMVDLLGDGSAISIADLQRYEPARRRSLAYRYRDAVVHVPGPPSIAGLLVLQALRALEDHGRMPAPLGAAQVRFLAHALERVERSRKGWLTQRLFDPGFVDGFFAALAPGEVGEERAHTATDRKPGHTTHISVVDADGNACGITSTLGESSGLLVPGTGLLLNNLLGEADVNPPDAAIGPGRRLMTMCCPTIIEIGDHVYVMGSGGSSRIRSAILHGVVYLTDHGMSPEEAVAAPRSHFEAGTLHVESEGRPAGAMEAIAVAYPAMKRFDGPNMFFGGLHVAGFDGKGFVGAGDARRSGAFGVG